MPELAAAALWGGLIALLLARAFFQYRCFPSVRVAEGCPDPAPSVAVIVPARNERRNIGKCVRALVAQRYPASAFDIIVVNDGSTDGTGEIVRAYARRHARVQVLDAGSLPKGWTGKSHACWVGACAPAAMRADWLCFVDADTTAQPAFLASVMSYALETDRDMLSICPFQRLSSLWERIFFPVGFVMISFFQHLREANDAHSDRAAANGQCLVFRRTAYLESGGHAAVASEVCEDTALAVHMKKTGHDFGIAGGERVIETHMYRGLREMYEGLGKNIVETLGGVPETLAAIVIAVVLSLGTIGMPLWTATNLAQHASDAAAVAFALSAMGSAALLITYMRAASYFDVAPWYAMLFPAGYAVGIAIAVSGLTCGLRGAVTWKGRTIYRQPPARARWNSIRRVASRIRLTWERR